MASTTTQTVPIPSPNLHVTAEDTGRSRGPVSELGTIDRLDSPGAESSVSSSTHGPFSPPPPLPTGPSDPAHIAGYDFSRQRTASNLSPPQQQGEWTTGSTHTRARSSSQTRYYQQARERSGTVSSTNNDHNRNMSMDNGRTTSNSPPQASRSFSPPNNAQQYPMSSPPQNRASSPPSGTTPSAYPPQHPPQYPQGDNPNAYPPQAHAAPQQGQNPADIAMVTPLEHLGNESANVDCPRCQTSTRTAVTKEAGDAVTLWSVVLCCLTGVLCAWIPCVIDDCKDTVHRCSQCQLLLATVTSSGAVRIAQGVNKPVASQYARQPQMEAGQEYKPYEAHRDAGPAPAYWESQQYNKPPKQYQQQYQQPQYAHQEAASVPLVEMEAAPVVPVELPAERESGKPAVPAKDEDKKS